MTAPQHLHFHWIQQRYLEGESSKGWVLCSRPHRVSRDQSDPRYATELLGTRLFADDAVGDSLSPVLDQVRTDYMSSTIGAGLRWKLRMLPRLNVSFPVTENNFSIQLRAQRTPHPRFLYAGLDPNTKTARSFQSRESKP